MGSGLFSTMYPGAYSAAEHHWRRDPAMGDYHIEGKRLCSQAISKMCCACSRQPESALFTNLGKQQMALAGQKMRGAPWLHLSSLGMGTYLGDADDRTDEQVNPIRIASMFRHCLSVDALQSKLTNCLCDYR